MAKKATKDTRARAWKWLLNELKKRRSERDSAIREADSKIRLARNTYLSSKREYESERSSWEHQKEAAHSDFEAGRVKARSEWRKKRGTGDP